MEAQNLQFCFYYKADDMDVERFLDFICAHMGKWEPRGGIPGVLFLQNVIFCHWFYTIFIA